MTRARGHTDQGLIYLPCQADLDHEVGIDHTDHTDHTDHADHTDHPSDV